MTTHGTVTYRHPTAEQAAAAWRIDTTPNLRATLRRLFPATNYQKTPHIELPTTPDKSRDLEWFLQRYPHRIDPHHHRLLTSMADVSRETERDAAEILSNGYEPQPVNLATPLRSYQALAVDLCRKVKGLLLGDDLGLGKTAVGIALTTYQDARPAVVICQTHLPRQWAAQFKKFAPQLSVEIAQTMKPHAWRRDVLILPSSKAAGWRDALDHIKTLVLDEAQECRKSTSAKYAAVSSIARNATYRLGLTATPVYNYGGETFNVCEPLRPGELGTAHEFIREWCAEGGHTDTARVLEPQALGAYLREKTIMLRRTRADVGREVPPAQIIAQVVPFKHAVIDAFLKKDAHQLARTILTGSFTERGQASREFDNRLRQATGIAKAPYVAELVIDLAQAGKKVVLGGWHRQVYEIWREAFKEKGVPHWLYTGTESATAKAAAVEAFTKAPEGAVLILSLRSGAGLDGLQYHSDTIVSGELDWSPKVHEQFNGRVVRDGQENESTIIYPIAETGSDPVMAKILGVKIEQGLGITDPTVDPGQASNQFGDSNNEEIVKNRSAALARDFLSRYDKAHPSPEPEED